MGNLHCSPKIKSSGYFPPKRLKVQSQQISIAMISFPHYISTSIDIVLGEGEEEEEGGWGEDSVCELAQFQKSYSSYIRYLYFKGTFVFSYKTTKNRISVKYAEP